MGVYLIDNPPRVRQFRSPRREKPSGVIVVHSAESYPDEVGPDTGAENVAAFIQRRRTHGSYHDVCDADSIIQLVRYSDEAYQDGTGSNVHALSVSAATQAHKWRDLDPDYAREMTRNMAFAAATQARWLLAEHGVVVPTRRITRAESDARKPGFISHAERDPGRRTDPGSDFPWGDFLEDYAAFAEDGDTGDDDMAMTEADFQRINLMMKGAFKAAGVGVNEVTEKREWLVTTVSRGLMRTKIRHPNPAVEEGWEFTDWGWSVWWYEVENHLLLKTLLRIVQEQSRRGALSEGEIETLRLDVVATELARLPSEMAAEAARRLAEQDGA